MKVSITVLLIMFGMVVAITEHGLNLKRVKRSINDISQECQDLLRSSAKHDKVETYDELVCSHWAYGFSKEEAESIAVILLQKGDFDGNGEINGNEIYGRPN